VPALILLLAVLLFSVILRVRNKKRSSTHEMPEHARPSPLSEAIVELVALAGGIYLSLLLLVSFLKIDLPDRLNFLGLDTDPLALFALVLTVLQPFWVRIQNFIKQGSG
jgi:hypothetical protein